MDSPVPSDFPADDLDSSTPVARKRARGSLHPCDLTAEFMNDSFDRLFADENEDPFPSEDTLLCHSQPVLDFPKPTPFIPVVPGEMPPSSPLPSSPSAVKSTYIPFVGRSSPFRSPGMKSPKFGSALRLSQRNLSPARIIPLRSSQASGIVGTPNVGGTLPLGSLSKSSQSVSIVATLSSSPLTVHHSSVSQAGMTSSGIIERLQNNASTSSANEQPSVRNVDDGIFSGLEAALQLQSQLAAEAAGPFCGLPARTAELFRLHKGIGELYAWQRECLALPAVRARRNLVYSLPTSGGKTLVAEILLLREMLCRGRDAVFIMPYVSLVQEKVRGLSPFAVDLGFAIEECAGAKGTIPPRRRRKRRALYACTIEKARALVDSLCEAGRLHEIGLVAVDELHMVGETGGRGAVLEATLAKLLCAAPDTQVVGMSATLSNMADLAAFLHADVYRRDFRPVELREFVKVGDELFEADGEEWRLSRRLDFGYTKEMRRRDPDTIAGLVREVIPENACLVFCPTKKHCENVALTVCSLLPPSLLEHKKEQKERLLLALREEGGGEACDTLVRCFPYGVAYHHGGLTMDERKLIEEAYLGGVLCCLCCTSTLAAGVNLPAKRVILRAPYVGSEFITLSRYKQMVGRAGRAGLDSSGESVLVIRPGDRVGVAALLSSPLDVCRSNFVTQPELVPSLVLSLVGLGLASTLEGVRAFWQRTLAAAQEAAFDEREVVDGLVYHGLLEWEEGGVAFAVTPLGKAAFRGGVDVETAQAFLTRLRTAMDGMVLHSHLHLLHLVTPDDYLSTVPFSPEVLLQEFSELSPEEARAAEACGASERAVVLAAGGRGDRRRVQQLHRFQLTLVLSALWRQQGGVWGVSRRFRLHRGTVQALLSAAGALAATLAAFCAELHEFWAFQVLLPDFARQLSYCVSSELLPLMELPAVKRGRARQLHSAGFKTLADVARASPEELVSRVPHLPRRQARQVVAAAKMILTEKAEALRDEAEGMMEEFEQNCSLLNEISDSFLFQLSQQAKGTTTL